MHKSKTFTIVVIALVVVGIGLLVYPNFQSGPTNLGPFASCLKDKGVIFYGAWWCPHCTAQKKLFGNAVDQLRYVECSAPDGKSQLAECTTAGVKSYPTWRFSDGSELTGEIPLSQLAEKSSCELPK